jgi:hypothetical protein
MVVNLTTVTSMRGKLTVVAVAKGWRCGGVLGPCRVDAVQEEPLRQCSQTGRRPPLRQLR